MEYYRQFLWQKLQGFYLRVIAKPLNWWSVIILLSLYKPTKYILASLLSNNAALLQSIEQYPLSLLIGQIFLFWICTKLLTNILTSFKINLNVNQVASLIAISWVPGLVINILILVFGWDNAIKAGSGVLTLSLIFNIIGIALSTLMFFYGFIVATGKRIIHIVGVYILFNLLEVLIYPFIEAVATALGKI